MPCLSGFCSFFVLLYLCICVRDTFLRCAVCVMRVPGVPSDHAHETDDGAKAAYVVAWKEERLMHGVVDGHAKYAVVVFGSFLHTLDENPLACFEDIDGAPLEEAYVGDLVASEEVAAIIERHHGVARHPDEEVSPLVLELWDDVTLAVLDVCATAPISREAGNGIERNERNALVATVRHVMCSQCQMLRLRICGRCGERSPLPIPCLKHRTLTC